jgi:hypothetical protein
MSVEVSNTSPTSTRTEQLSDLIARSLAQHVSRRSFLGRLGKGAVAASLGAAGAEALFFPQSASAITCGVNGCSVQCSHFPGWNQNSCPTGTCECGSWCFTQHDSNCPNTYKKWSDCCGGICNGGANCKCVDACGTSYPSCCYQKYWTGFGCGQNDWYIACRASTCSSYSNCDVHSDECLGVAC